MLNLHAKEVMKGPEILYGEFLLQSCNGAAQKTSRRSCQDNIIHIQQQIDNIIAMVIDEQ